MSLSNAQIIGVGSVAFMALTYRNLDLKYTMNEKIDELEQSLEKQKRENKILARELDALRNKKTIASYLPDLSKLVSWRRERKEDKPKGKPKAYSGGTL